jgi:hypothetical protein
MIIRMTGIGLLPQQLRCCRIIKRCHLDERHIRQFSAGLVLTRLIIKCLIMFDQLSAEIVTSLI